MNLTYLNLGDNDLTGSIPSFLASLSELTYLGLYNNSLSNFIPSQLGGLVALTYFDIESNKITNSIPSSFGRLVNLDRLILGNNSLTGQIPSSLRSLQRLTRLTLRSNLLVGPIPDIFGGMSTLKYLSLDNNALTSNLPSSLYSLSALCTLRLRHNQLSGYLFYSTTVNLLSLTELRLEFNKFRGTIPNKFSSLTSLQTLVLRNNFFSGPLPSSLFTLTELAYVSLSFNKFTSTISPSIGALAQLLFLSLAKCSFTGPLPRTIGNLQNLTVLNVRYNFLSGSVPDEVGSLTNLKVLNLSSNTFTGSLPSTLGHLTQLVLLGAYNNTLSGELPWTLAQASSLEQVYLYDNAFEGSIDVFFRQQSNFPALKFLDLSQNAFTSGLQSFKYIPPNLQFLALFMNCFRGVFAFDQLCSARSLETLILDGLSSADSCRIHLNLGEKRMAPLVDMATALGYGQVKFNAYRIDRLGGKIPGCIFGLPNISTLHASGNGLKGLLPQSPDSWSGSLRKLSLSFNALTGNIPLPLQRHAAKMEELDLEYNKLDGNINALTVDESASWSLKLEVNRLSGYLPASLAQAKGVLRLLAGNMFDCPERLRVANGVVFKEEVLPRADPDHKFYVCSSHNFDDFMAIFAVAVVLSAFYLVVQMLVFQKFERLRMLLRSSMFKGSQKRERGTTAAGGRSRTINSAASTLHITSFTNVLSDCRAVSILLGIFSIFVLMPIYVTIKSIYERKFSMYQDQYAWIVSGIYISGRDPGVVLIFFWSVVLVLSVGCFFVVFQEKGSTTEAEALQQQLDSITTGLRQRAQTVLPYDHVDSPERQARPISIIRSQHVDSYPSQKQESRWSSYHVGRRLSDCLFSSGLLNVTIRLRLILRLVLVASFYCFACLAGYVTYVSLIFFSKLDSEQQFALQLGLAVYRPFLLYLCMSLFSWRPLLFGVHPALLETAPGFLRGGESAHLFFLVFDSIIAPCIAAALCDKTCFVASMSSGNKIELQFNRAFQISKLKEDGVEEFLSLNLVSLISSDFLTEALQVTELSYYPPFFYKYECTSSLIKIYGPTLIIGGIISAFCFPIFSHLARWLLDHIYQDHSVAAEKADLYLDADTDAARRQNATGPTEDASGPPPTELSAHTLPPLGRLQYCLLLAVPPLRRRRWERRLLEKDPWTVAVDMGGAHSTFVFINVNEVLLDVTKNLLLILSFGIVSPLVGLVLLLDVVSTCTRQQYLIMTFVDDSVREDEVEVLNADCALAWQKRKNIVFRMRWVLILFPSLFFALFIFDIVGDETGYLNGLWAPVLMVFLPSLCYFLTNRLFPKAFKRHAENIARGRFVPAVPALPRPSFAARRASQFLSMRMRIDSSTGHREESSSNASPERGQSELAPSQANPIFDNVLRERGLLPSPSIEMVDFIPASPDLPSGSPPNMPDA